MEGAQKLAAEGYVRLLTAQGRLPGTVLRVFSVYGEDQDVDAEDAAFVAKFIGIALAGKPITIHGNGSQTRDLIHANDVAEAIARVLGTAGTTGRVFNIASGEPVTVGQVATLVTELVGGLPPAKYLPPRFGEPHAVKASTAKAASILGFRARVRFRDGIAAWVRHLERSIGEHPPSESPTTAPLGFLEDDIVELGQDLGDDIEGSPKPDIPRA